MFQRHRLASTGHIGVGFETTNGQRFAFRRGNSESNLAIPTSHDILSYQHPSTTPHYLTHQPHTPIINLYVKIHFHTANCRLGEKRDTKKIVGRGSATGVEVRQVDFLNQDGTHQGATWTVGILGGDAKPCVMHGPRYRSFSPFDMRTTRCRLL